MSEIEKICITCDETGHTYLECPHVDFMSLFCASVGAPIIAGQSIDELDAGIDYVNEKKSNKP